MATPKSDLDFTSQAQSSGHLYAEDFYTWTQSQAELLRHQAWSQLDLPNLIEETQPWASRRARNSATA